MKKKGMMSNDGSRTNMGMTSIGGAWKGGVMELIWVAMSGYQWVGGKNGGNRGRHSGMVEMVPF